MNGAEEPAGEPRPQVPRPGCVGGLELDVNPTPQAPGGIQARFAVANKVRAGRYGAVDGLLKVPL